ncbi:hypothetical protein IF1G_07448 [Cordyceps javanica]|uniref:Uncharacterized protein n=1 Tax=Cordyceps javanica TaxID=43265 RepID=A0A545VS65_9HYPO|nr:hypothetical protein IF1G_07448 [Cordyceps javanica]TQW04505.1 hypothetical protein IF2G_07734 [Cordyceps javanica]
MTTLATGSPTSSSAPDPTHTVYVSQTPALPTGVKAGIGAGAAAFVVVLFLLAFGLYRRRRKEKMCRVPATAAERRERSEIDGEASKKQGTEADVLEISAVDGGDATKYTMPQKEIVELPTERGN